MELWGVLYSKRADFSEKSALLLSEKSVLGIDGFFSELFD